MRLVSARRAAPAAIVGIGLRTAVAVRAIGRPRLIARPYAAALPGRGIVQRIPLLILGRPGGAGSSTRDRSAGDHRQEGPPADAADCFHHSLPHWPAAPATRRWAGDP